MHRVPTGSCRDVVRRGRRIVEIIQACRGGSVCFPLLLIKEWYSCLLRKTVRELCASRNAIRGTVGLNQGFNLS